MTAAQPNEAVLIPKSFLNLLFSEQQDWIVLLAETSSQKAYLISFQMSPVSVKGYSNQPEVEFVILKEFSISSGKQKGSKRSEWDLRTPEGYYRITQYRPPHTLQDKFGTGAFILNYPNELDRILEKTGSGIWVHGTDRIDFIDCDSEGCLRMKNEDIVFLRDYLVPDQTPVIIVNQIDWQTTDSLCSVQNEWRNRFSGWLSAQANNNLTRFLTFYHPSFYAPILNKDMARWSLYQKETIFNEETPAVLSFSDPKILYHQDFLLWKGLQTTPAAQNTNSKLRTVLWQFTEGEWYIVRETNEEATE
jgi:murein L,D-transpeptidase YafK